MTASAISTLPDNRDFLHRIALRGGYPVSALLSLSPLFVVFASAGWAGRALVYGAAGWCAEILFTGLAAIAKKHDRAATGRTYLWMFPIYAGGGLLLELVARVLATAPMLGRLAAYVALIYVVEYLAGWLLKHLLGRCPWDYTGRGINIKGLVRLDYAPVWLVIALGFDELYRVAGRFPAPT